LLREEKIKEGEKLEERGKKLNRSVEEEKEKCKGESNNCS